MLLLTLNNRLFKKRKTAPAVQLAKGLFSQKKTAAKATARTGFHFSVDFAVERNALGACVGLGRSLRSVRLRRGIASSRSAGGTSSSATFVIAAL